MERSTLKKAGIITLETLAGGVAGLTFASNCINATSNIVGDPGLSAMSSYASQLDTNIAGALVGAALPLAYHLGRAVYKFARN